MNPLQSEITTVDLILNNFGPFYKYFSLNSFKLIDNFIRCERPSIVNSNKKVGKLPGYARIDWTGEVIQTLPSVCFASLRCNQETN